MVIHLTEHTKKKLDELKVELNNPFHSKASYNDVVLRLLEERNINKIKKSKTK